MADDSTDVFDGLFGKARSAEEQEAADREWERESNENARKYFQRERDHRAEYVAMDLRIRNIVNEEIMKCVWMGILLAGVYSANRDYGTVGGIAVFVAGIAIWIWHDRKSKKRPRYNIEESDELAEDTIGHRRIVEFEEAGKPWVTVKGDHMYFEEFFQHPFWKQVNEQVHEYVRMSPAERKAHNRAARNASLPYRIAMLTKLRTHDKEWELPHFAWIDHEERKKN
ncbi:hypothetical protein [Sphingobium sp.]|uniref:hypothetical protein n=1 Tax=Sphingobium sp. TaxID=1912891 RepID=UPI0028BD89A1|nr:hypothetical protein [Sphingobium sp.]